MSKKTKDPANDEKLSESEIDDIQMEEEANDTEQSNSIDINKGLLEQIENLQLEANKAQNNYLRTVADMENLRKRVARDKEDIRRRAGADLIEDLLPALDNLEIGLNEAKKHEQAKNIVHGFDVVVAQLNQILKQHGLERIEPASGDAFDHHSHEAMAQETSQDISDNHICRVVRSGYSLNERLLRPASVIVSSGPDAEET